MARADPPGEYAEAVRRHQAMVFSLALHLLRDRSLAEEVAQDVLVQLRARLPELKSEQHLIFWLRRVVVHRAIDQGRATRRAQLRLVSLDALDEEPATSSDAPVPDALMMRQLRVLVGRLSDKARAVVVLRYQEDLGPQEISQLLNMPVATVKSHLQRSLQALREAMLEASEERVG